jgi:1,2-diacylglycerol 3-alpha-glucosyltransferase
MRILIASESYKFQTNGVANVVTNLVDGLRELGHDVKVLAPANERRSYREGDNYFFASIPAFFYPDQRLSLARHEPLLDELALWRPDIIHLHTEGTSKRFAQYIAKKDHIPIIMTAHTNYAQYIFGRFQYTLPIKLMVEYLGKMIYDGKAGIVLPSEKARAFRQFARVTSPLYVIPSGIKTEFFKQPVSSKERTLLLTQLQLSDNGAILVMVTRISHEKNIMEILRYFKTLLKYLPEAQLLIVGDGPDRKRLESFCKRSNITKNVRFTGRIDPNQVYRYYNLGDIFVSASTFETQGLTYLEASACGLPMVCREDSVLKGVLDYGKNGYTYRSEQEFVEEIKHIVRNRPLWQAMHKEALKKSEDFDTRLFVRQTLSLYEKILNRENYNKRK